MKKNILMLLLALVAVGAVVVNHTHECKETTIVYPELRQTSSFHHIFVAVSDDVQGHVVLANYSPDIMQTYGNTFGAICIGGVRKGDFVNLGYIKENGRTVRYLAKAL